MLHVTVSTTEEGYQNWSFEIDVERGTTVAGLKELLAGPPHNLPVPASNKVLERRGGLLMGLTDKKVVTKEVALVGFVPATLAPAKAPELPAPKPTAPVRAPAVVTLTVKVTTTLEQHQSWQRVVDVPKDVTIADLKRMLTGPPHNLQLVPGQKVLVRQKNQNFLSGTKDTDKVSPELVLLNFNPDGLSPKENKSPTSQTQAQAEEFKNYKRRDVQAEREARKAGEVAYRFMLAKFYEQAAAERRFYSYCKVIEFGKLVLGMTGRPVRRGTPEQPCVVWVLNSSDAVEVDLARTGIFANVSELDPVPTDLVLMGHEVDELEIDATETGYGGVTARVRTANYSAVAKERHPDYVVLLMPQMGAKQTTGTALCAGPARLPKDVLVAIRGAPIVVSTRRMIPPDALNTLPGSGRVGGSVVFSPLRCPFSAYAQKEGVEFDDNGWLIGISDPDTLVSFLTIDMLPEFQESKRSHDDAENRTPALFWGIMDLKYDSMVPLRDRVKMLETGDGRTSRFSGAGAVILRRYKEKYRLEEGPGTGKSAVISANKKLTHDLMVIKGFEHLVPRQVCCNRVYTEDLAEKIMKGLDVGEDDVVVLKLCNRTRAAGVLPVPVLDLDNMLKKVLRAPKDFEGWISRELSKGDAATLEIHYGCLEEQIRHWWSNECPFFVAERLATSTPTTSSWSGKELDYDGTMRVAFALHRKSDKKSPQNRNGLGHMGGGPQTMPEPDDIEIEWLGGYWKLPKEPVESCKLRESIISAAKTGTTYVDTNHLLEVFAAFGDCVQQLFGGSEPVANSLAEYYAAEPELASYLVGRIGIAMRDLSSCRRTVDLARKVLEKAEDGPCKKCAQSFVSRGFGVVDAMTPPGRWTEAQAHFQKSIECLPANASSLYLQGQAHLERGETKLAVDLMRRAMILDLDFRAPYVNLGVAYLRLQQFDAAIAVSEAVLKRHPDSPQSNYHIAVACYHKSLRMEAVIGRPTPEQKEEYDQLRARGLRELIEARDSDEAQRSQHRNRIEAPWTEDDDFMIEFLKPGTGFLGKKRDPKIRAHRPLEIQPDTGWRFIGWRT